MNDVLARIFSGLRCCAGSVAFAVGMSLSASALAGPPPTMVPQPGVTAPASIAELARALKYDANTIFEYVYNNIEYTPTYGVHKGALGTLLDGVGNDMDQAVLLGALLTQSGYSVTYINGNLTLSAAQIAAWLGTDPANPPLACYLLGEGGLPYGIYPVATTCTNAITDIYFAHTWLAVTGGSYGSTTYYLDPSYKQYTTATAGMNLATATGYSQSSFMTTAKAGSTSGTNSIQNLNTANIQGALQGYANSLVSYIKANNPHASPQDVLGGRYVQPLSQPFSPPTGLPSNYFAVHSWSDIPDAYKTHLRVTMGSGTQHTWSTDSIYGHRLSIVYDSSNRPNLYVDGTLIDTGAANVNTINYEVDYLFCFQSSLPPNCGTGYANYTRFQSVIKVGNGYTYAIVNGWDLAGRGMVEFHRRQLQLNKASGATDGSESVLGEALNMVGFSWLAQLAATAKLNDQLLATRFVMHSAVGVVGAADGPYIDIPSLFAVASPLTTTANTGFTAFAANFSAGSALEWGALDQSFLNSGVGALSTVKLFDIANTAGNVFYQANSANWSTVSASLSGYSSTDLATINTNYISQGWTVVLPQHGNLTQGAWTGAGWFASNAALQAIGYLISHNIKGGYTDAPLPAPSVPQPVVDTAPVLPAWAFTQSAEPIDLFSGAYLYDHDDLAVGSGAYPLTLGFRRSYNSNNAGAVGPLGAGWTHNFNITALINSDGLKGLGQDAPVDGAAAIAASYVIQDLLSDTSKPIDKMVVATLVQKWLMDRLINNTVNIANGSQGEQFVLLADGSYNAQLGSTDRLALGGGAYTLTDKYGTTTAFNTAGNVTQWQTPAGTSVSFTYDSATPPKLASVSNNTGRTLSLSYNGSNQLTSVSDNASPSRSVSYTFDGLGNLASFADPNANTATYSYAPGLGSTPSGLLTRIFYPSSPTVASVTNTYDTLGRVMSQANATGATWTYYFAGYRSEEDDANGTQHVLLYNPRGRPLFEIQDLAGLDLVTSTLYDGIDLPYLITQPEGGQTLYYYWAAPWYANNLAQITRKPKPGSSLSWLSTEIYYDATWNKPTLIQDPLNLKTTMAYDGATGSLLSTVADSGSGHFNATTRYTYNPLGQPLTVTDPLGVVTQYAYDGSGNLTSTVRDPGSGSHINATTSYAYDQVGNVTSTTNPNSRTTANAWDAGRRLLTTTLPSSAGTTGAGVATALIYDADNRVLQTRQSLAGTILRTTSATYTATGKQATATDANGNVTRYAYDLLDRLSTTTDAMNRVTRYTYDALSRPYQVFNPAIVGSISGGALVQQTYTADGLRASLTDAGNHTTSFAYDGFDRLSTTTYPDSTTEAYTYDADSNVLTRKTRASSSTTFTYAYDTLNRLTSKTPATGPVVNYSYDLMGRMTGVSDNSSAIHAIATPGTTTAYSTSYSYNALNQPVGVSFGDVPAATTSPTTITPVVFTHSYNAVNQRTGQSVSDNSWISYPGSAAATAYTSNNLNQYTTVGSASPTYDNNGNLLDDGTNRYGYDPDNRLVSLSPSGSGTACVTACYTFDGRGRRKTKTVGTTTTVSITDADNREVLEYDGSSGTILRWYAYGLGANDLVSQINLGGTTTRSSSIRDMLGSVIGGQDAATGTITSFAYKAYGSNASPPAQFAYTGQRVDTESGLYYYRARHYSPGTGRFLQVDPIGYSASILIYAYVGNDPLNFFDPTGFAQTSDPGGFTLEPPAQSPSLGGATLNPGFQLVADPLGAYRVTPPAGTPIGPYGDPYVPNGQLTASARLVLEARVIFYDPSTDSYAAGYDLSFFGTVTPTNARRGPDRGDRQSGFVYSPPGAPPIVPGENPQSAVRVTFANAVTGFPAMQFYNANGQLISPITGNTVSTGTSHYPIGNIR